MLTSTKIVGEWYAIRAVAPTTQNTFLIAMIYNQDSENYCIASFQVIIKDKRMVITLSSIVEQNFEIQNMDIGEGYSDMIEDEDGQIYCVIWCRNAGENPKTWFHIVAVSVNDRGEIIKVIINGIIIDDHWFMPYIENKSIGFLSFHDAEAQWEMPFTSLSDPCAPRRRRTLISDKYGKIPHSRCWVTYCLFDRQRLYYIFDQVSMSSELWGLSSKLGTWKKYSEFSKHAVPHGKLALTRGKRIIILGGCVEEDCGKIVHDYQPDNGIIIEKVSLNIYQLSAFHSRSKVQVICGLGQYELTMVMLLKALECINVSCDKNNVFIYVVDETIKYHYVYACNRAFGDSFNQQNIKLLKPDSLGYIVADDCTIFIDFLHTLNYDMKEWLRRRRGSSFIALKADIQSGLDQPRTEFDWHFLTPMPLSNQGIDQQEEMLQRLESDDKLKFMKLSMEAMDYFYLDWFSDSIGKETVCIPASLDLTHNRYRGTSEANAAGYDESRFAVKKPQWTGQKAEDAFLHCFQKLEIGGVLLHGVDTEEYARLRKMESMFKKWKIGAVEMDFLFIHRLLGIFVIEVKGVGHEILFREASAFKKAITQLEKTKKLIPILFENLTGSSFDLPIYSVVCFPFAKIHQLHPIADANIEFIDASIINETERMKEVFLKKLQLRGLSDEKLFALRKFTCSIAGYRSVDFMSAGFNALSVHKILSHQSFDENITAYHDDIFLTNEQQTIIDCIDKHQIISGPPGTGKTLIILSKAMQAATVAKAGSVRIITDNKSLRVKFSKFFEASNSTIQRFPVINDQWRAEDEDDVFTDEDSFTTLQQFFLQKRLNASGSTIVALTGFLRTAQIVDIEESLVKLGLSNYRHFPMTTVIRNTISIFNEWKVEYPPDMQLCMGHSVSGQITSKQKVLRVSDVLEKVHTTVLQFFPQSQKEIRNRAIFFKLLPKHHCIATSINEDCIKIKSFLTSNGIACGSVEEQLCDPNLVAVTSFLEILSFEWPIVIMASLNCSDISNPFVLISSSRCIARLIIIERDYMAVQHKIDEKLGFCPPSVCDIPFDKFLKVVRDTSLEFEEQDEDAFAWDVYLAFIRHNYLPFNLQRLQHFQGCLTLLECLPKIASSDILCSILLDEQESFGRCHSVSYLDGNWSMKARGDLPKLLQRLWPQLGKPDNATIWKMLQNLVEKLAKVRESAEANRNEDFTRRKETFLATLQPDYGWDFFVGSIGLILIASELLG